MKIVQLTAENVKRLKAVQIKPDGNVVQITGKNGAGKSSILDSLWWALAGATHIQAEPIRKGAKSARIRLDLGELIVTRVFKRGEKEGDPPYTTSIVVESAEGARFPKPQALLDGLLGALAFDPLEFARADAGEQFDRLRRFVPGFDFEATDAANASDYAKRTEINRDAKRLRAAAASIEYPMDGMPSSKINVAAIKDQLQHAADENASRYAETKRRERVAEDIARMRQGAANYQKEADRLRREADGFQQRAVEALGQAAGSSDALEALPPVPGAIDVAALRAQLDNAERVNAQLDNREEAERLGREAHAQEEQAKALTARMEARETAKREAIAAASMPVPGLGFGDGVVLLNGVPFEQASDAEKLRVSVAIALAENPKLRVIRIRDGSLLDEDSMKLLAEMADTADFQVWIEVVGTGPVGFIIENGELVGATAAAEATDASV